MKKLTFVIAVMAASACQGQPGQGPSQGASLEASSSSEDLLGGCVNTGCPDDAHPICNVLTGACGTCLTPVECLLRNASEPWCSSAGACVGCVADNNCGGLTPQCNTLVGLCIPRVCAGLNPIVNGNVDLNVAVTGDVRVYTCVGANVMTGSSTTTCQSDGSWSHPAPTCAPAPGSCTADADCSADGRWCDIAAHTCRAKVANGGTLPTDTGHTSPVLNGSCSSSAGTLVCASGVCDSDGKCGYANGDGACTSDTTAVCRSSICGADHHCGLANGEGTCSILNGGTICRSQLCSVLSAVCIPATGGCGSDLDCGLGQWCNTSSYTCSDKLPNEAHIPTVTGHSPALTGDCSVTVGASVCASGVCSTSDSECGLPNGEACTILTQGACRSNKCDGVLGVCTSAATCLLDSDCSSGNYCDTVALTCKAKLPNGTPIPLITGHVPSLVGICNLLAAQTVCASGTCSNVDNKCGYTSGDGPCDASDAGRVCRSGACSEHANECIPQGGCASDDDCGASEWCNAGTFTCTPKLPNGDPIPTDPTHSPTLIGLCTADVGAAVCASGACSTSDNKCGLPTEEGPCASIGVCRSGACNIDLSVCIDNGHCEDDSDCTSVQYCDTVTTYCAPKVLNGFPIPTVPGHAPAIEGVCDETVAGIVCLSGVCDSDNKCGHGNGHGPCDVETGLTVCRSALCNPATSLCVECTSASDCVGIGAACDTVASVCVQCTLSDDVACVGSTPVCNVYNETCDACDGDYGDRTVSACNDVGSPYCFSGGASTGSCGRCTADADCDGHTGGEHCDTDSGACVERDPGQPRIDKDNGGVTVKDRGWDGMPSDPDAQNDDSAALAGFTAAGAGCTATGSDAGLAAVLVAGLVLRALRRRR